MVFHGSSQNAWHGIMVNGRDGQKIGSKYWLGTYARCVRFVVYVCELREFTGIIKSRAVEEFHWKNAYV